MIHHSDGLWVVPSSELLKVSVGKAVSLDLIYLDKDYRVVHVVESSPTPRGTSSKVSAASVLAFPAHTVYLSQTRIGDRLVVCIAEALEFRLKSAFGGELSDQASLGESEIKHDIHSSRSLPQRFVDERRRGDRQLWPNLIAFDHNGSNMSVHGIRDVSVTGLYLLTEHRWPLGTIVMMTLQATDNSSDRLEHSIAVQVKVVRWGSDGVGLQFVLPGVLESAQS